MKILAADPGGTTGLVLLSWSRELPADPTASEVLWHAQMAPEDAEDAIEGLLADNRADVMAIERFVLGPGASKMTRQLDALYLIGS